MPPPPHILSIQCLDGPLSDPGPGLTPPHSSESPPGYGLLSDPSSSDSKPAAQPAQETSPPQEGGTCG